MVQLSLNLTLMGSKKHVCFTDFAKAHLETYEMLHTDCMACKYAW